MKNKIIKNIVIGLCSSAFIPISHASESDYMSSDKAYSENTIEFYWEKMIKNHFNQDVRPLWNILDNGNDFDRVIKAKSIMKRTDDKVCIDIKTSELKSGAYTAWWIIFNNPSVCNFPIEKLDTVCGAEDMMNPDAQVTGMWAASSVVGPNGEAIINTCINKDELTHDVFPFGEQKGLTNVNGSEIHFAIRYHGPADFSNAESLGNQLNSYDGGCAFPEYGVPGFACEEVQSVIHKPQD